MQTSFTISETHTKPGGSGATSAIPPASSCASTLSSPALISTKKMSMVNKLVQIKPDQLQAVKLAAPYQVFEFSPV